MIYKRFYFFDRPLEFEEESFRKFPTEPVFLGETLEAVQDLETGIWYIPKVIEKIGTKVLSIVDEQN